MAVHVGIQNTIGNSDKSSHASGYAEKITNAQANRFQAIMILHYIYEKLVT